MKKTVSLVHGALGSILIPSAEMPNPSIELTCPGKPGHAAHVAIVGRIKGNYDPLLK